MSDSKTCPLCRWCYFFYRSIRSTVNVCVTPIAAAAPLPTAPTVLWRTRASVPTTATIVAAKLAMQQPTDRCRQHRPTHEYSQTYYRKKHSWVLKLYFSKNKWGGNQPVWQDDFTCTDQFVSVEQIMYYWIKRHIWYHQTYFFVVVKNDVKTY